MRPYIRENLSKDALRAIAYFVKVTRSMRWPTRIGCLQVLALASETVIFIFLGLSTVSSSHHWDTSFIVLTVVFCLVYRAIGLFTLPNAR